MMEASAWLDPRSREPPGYLKTRDLQLQRVIRYGQVSILSTMSFVLPRSPKAAPNLVRRWTAILTIIVVSGFSWPGLLASDQEFRVWTFQDGAEFELKLANAYGSKVYFTNKKGHSFNVEILALAEADRAEVVYWSRKRDAAVTSGTLAPGKFTRQFRKDAEKYHGKEPLKVNWEEKPEPEFYAVYTSASWCQPCRGFTPKLVEFYKANKPAYGDVFEFILCSWDEGKSKMLAYMEEENMPWYGNWKNRNSRFWRKYQGNGIPCLVIVDRNGYILSHSYDADGYIGPRVPMEDLRKLFRFVSNDPNERLSVPTPGINFDNWDDVLQQQLNEAIEGKKSLKPAPVLVPTTLLTELEDSEEEMRELVLKLDLTKQGVVSNVELINMANPDLEERLFKALVLWQFFPAISAEGEPYKTVAKFPLQLRLKDEFLVTELSNATMPGS